MSLTTTASNGQKQGNFDLLSCGLVSGVLQSIIFNPWDKALYLSIKLERPFLDMRNFEHPMKGMTQTLAQRAVSSGLYFPLEDIFRTQLNHHLGQYNGHRSVHNFLSGTLAGLFNGLIMNPFVSVRVSKPISN